MPNLKNIFLSATAVLVGYFSYSQNWTKQQSEVNRDSIFAIYAWEEHDQFHASGGKIVLTKNGRFKYMAFRPLSYKEHSEGTYWIKKDTLILSSDLQTDNLRVEITYADSKDDNNLYGLLLHPLNIKGDTLYNAYYFLNNDTSWSGHYDPSFSSNINPLTVVQNLKVAFYDTNLGSAWIPVAQPGKAFKVRILDDVDLSDRTYKVLKDWKLKIVDNKLIDLSLKKYNAPNIGLPKAAVV